jgi:peptidoglycan-associated lipoprotein
MQKNLGIKLAVLLMSLTLILTVSCQKKTVAVDDGTNSTARTEGNDSPIVDQSNTVEEPLYSSTTEADDDSKIVLQGNIFFEYDKATLMPEARETLTINGKWLRLNSDVVITIEGHCDERGTNGYNLALGDRRAESVKTFLVDLGIDRSRLTTLSYGEERPLDRGNGESAWARNRRAHFLIR